MGKVGMLRVPSVAQRLGAIACAGMLASSVLVVSAPAYAADAEPSVSGNATTEKTNTGSGSTDVTIQVKTGTREVSGTNDPNNPSDGSPDDLGENVAFTVPTSINFVSSAQGVLTGPSAEATFIKNESAFDIHTSSVRVDAESGWSLVSDAQASADENALDFQIGPEDDMLDASSYREKQAVHDKSKWHMTSKRPSGTDDAVLLKTQGNINNITADLKSRTKVAVINWYVTPGAGA